MQIKFIEATNNNQNWGKFIIIRFDNEWEQKSSFTNRSLLQEVGWSPDNIIVFDLQTGEGARFRPGGLASADLNKHKIFCCPMFEPFLEWLYKQNLDDFSNLPNSVNLPDAKFEMYGHRREGIK